MTSYRDKDGSEDVAQRVRQVIGGRIDGGQGSPDIECVAESIHTSVRTLQRRLQAIGLTYAGVVQQARYEAARQMLADRRRRIGEIARTLGYSDPAHFTRAFQRWAGRTPRDFRDGRGDAADRDGHGPAQS